MIIKCKQCGNEHDTEHRMTILVTVVGKRGQTNDPMLHFCGYRCLTEWSEDRECTEAPDRTVDGVLRRAYGFTENGNGDPTKA